jgi:hypothetical protein
LTGSGIENLPAWLFSRTQTVAAQDVVMAWRASTAGDGVGRDASNVLTLTLPTVPTFYVLEMAYDPAFAVSAAAANIAYYDIGSSAWVLAGANRNAGLVNVGDYWVDTDSNTVSVVLNHASSFVVVVPEPGTLTLLAGGILGLLAYWRRRRHHMSQLRGAE